MGKKVWLFIGLGAVALAGIVLLLVFSLNNGNNDDPQPFDTYVVTTTAENPTWGTISMDSKTNVHNSGDSPTYTITPKENYCIKEIILDGVNVWDYTTNATINVTDSYSHCFEGISANHTIKVVFDETLDLSALNYKTVLKGADEGDTNSYGSVSVWGASEVFPKTGKVKLLLNSNLNFKLYSYNLPGEEEERLTKDNYEITDSSGENEITTLSYNGTDNTILLSSFAGELLAIEDKIFTIYYIPNTISLRIYYLNGGNLTMSRDETDEYDSISLFDKYYFPAEFASYNWQYARLTTGDSPSVILNNLTTIEVGQEGEGEEISYYIELLPEYYANNLDSRFICLVYSE